MTQEYIVVIDSIPVQQKIHDSLHLCENCSKIVPKTMLCMYCGSPILYRPPLEQ